MKLEIEWPDAYFFDTVSGSGDIIMTKPMFDEWWSQEIEPKNKIIQSGIKVYGRVQDGNYWSQDNNYLDTHTAIVIGMQPIKQESAVDVLKDFLGYYGDPSAVPLPETRSELIQRAMAALERENEK